MRYEILDGDTVTNTIIADASYMAANYPQGNYREVVVQEPASIAPVWAWYIDLGPFSDRLGATSAAIDLSTEPGVVVIRNDFSRRKWIDLEDVRVAAALAYLAGQPHPVLGTIGAPLMTTQQVATVLNTPVAAEENLALRKLYFS